MNKIFSILLPPPNITGSLHIGHYFNWSLQDLLLKYKQQQGYKTKWYTGLDHAGISTQYVVEKQLQAEGETRINLGREKFLNKILEWQTKAENLIEEQVKNFDFNMNWETHRFTMDNEHQKLVTESFEKFYNDGLITKKLMLTNWDTKFNTAISDLEVIEKNEKSKIYHIEYKSSNSKEESIIVATTRPETIFADVALCLNPNDPRANMLKNKTFLIPIINKKIPIIFDELCELNKGEGVLKVTPAHDQLDYEIGQKHNLALISIIDKEGKLYNTIDKLNGLKVEKARTKILEIFKEKKINFEEKQWIGIKKYTEKSNIPVETLLTEQWFLDVSSMAKEALNQCENITFYPNYLKTTFKHWMNNIKPWCISRQIWWGHQIPIWYKKDGSIICAKNKEEAIKKAKTQEITQEEDVLDTWFSSALWPNIATEPTDILITGKDILFFWVARMIMFNIYLKKELPFKAVYFNGIVRDKNNEKMSKTKGNVINPLEINEKYGQDILRFTLLKNSGSNKDIKLNEKELELSRNLITKIKNANKFLNEYMPKEENEHEHLNNWMEQKIYQYKEKITQNLNKYEIQKASEDFYNLFWNNFCSWYIEGLKQFPSQKAKLYFNEILRIGYPFLPKTIEKIININSIENIKIEDKKNNFEKTINIINLLRSIQKTCKMTAFYINFDQKMIQNHTKLTLNSTIKTKIQCENESIFIEEEYIKTFKEKIEKDIENTIKIIETLKLKIKNAKNVPNEIINEWRINIQKKNQ